MQDFYDCPVTTSDKIQKNEVRVENSIKLSEITTKFKYSTRHFKPRVPINT